MKAVRPDWFDGWEDLYESGTVSRDRMAELVGCGKGAVSRKAKKLGLKNPNRPPRHDWPEDWARLYTEGVKVSVIAEYVGADESVVSRKGKDLGLCRPKLRPTWADEFEAGLSVKEVARRARRTVGRLHYDAKKLGLKRPENRVCAWCCAERPPADNEPDLSWFMLQRCNTWVCYNCAGKWDNQNLDLVDYGGLLVTKEFVEAKGA